MVKLLTGGKYYCPTKTQFKLKVLSRLVLPPGEVELENGSTVKAHKFQVELDNASNILAYLPRHRHYIKILAGDRFHSEVG